MAPSVLYTSAVLGAIALYLLLRPGSRPVKVLAILLGLGALGWAVRSAVAAAGSPADGQPSPFFVAFSLIAVVAAVRLITHHRPVYAALYFVMVVLSSAGLFLLLEAEFMAFALIIVYAGAILITYLFVLMLAQQAPTAGEESRQAEYDVVPREPFAAVTVGFILLALLGDTVYNQAGTLPAPPPAARVRLAAWDDLDDLPGQLELAVRDKVEGFEQFTQPQGARIEQIGGEATVEVLVAGSDEPRLVSLGPEALPENIQRVGLGLVRDFPVSLELAGVILLLAMYGAVVLARRQIELSEAEKRQAARTGGAS